MVEPYRNRKEAGMILASQLGKYRNDANLLILALPRGGVVVAYEVADELDAELDVFIVRKLGAPYEPELAMGAIAEGGILLLNDAVINYLSISKENIEKTAKKELEELERRKKLYRNGREAPQIRGRTVLLIDDGIATGATMKVAIRAVRRKEPTKLIAAIPVGAPSSCMELKEECDEVICLRTPESFMSVGSCYQDFEQTTDDEVREYLQKAYEKQKRPE
jgi:putative phosphoribosyl transferase